MGQIPVIWECVARSIFDNSSLSLEDQINITANYWSLLNQDKDDEAELRNRGYSEARIESALKGKSKSKLTIGSLKFTKSTTKFKYDLIYYVLTLFENYENGNLPFPGSVSEQPAQIMEIFSILSNVRAHFYEKQNKQNALPKQRRK